MHTSTHRTHSLPGCIPPAMLAGLASATLLTGCGGGGDSRAGGPDLNVGLEGLVGDSPREATIDEPKSELEAMIDAQAASLAEAYGTPVEDLHNPQAGEEFDEPLTDSSLASILGGSGEPLDVQEPTAVEPADTAPASTQQAAAEDEDTQAPEAAAESTVAAEETREPIDVETLYAELDAALGQELDTTSEPFRTAVAMIALAAAQGRDPLEAIAPESRAGSALSPAERASATVVAELLASLLSAEQSGTAEHAATLMSLSERLSQNMGLHIPRALLCTEVRGFGRYTPFARTDFLAGRRIRALLYVEVDRFEHREVDTSSIGGLPVEERWAIDLSQTLELYHASGEILAWKRPEEVVVETSRNKQRDFYLLTDIQLPETLTVGAYQLKVIIRDRVAGATAEMLIPIGIVADPTLAWAPE